MARPRPAYQVEPVELRPLIWKRGYATPWELLRICAWKSAKDLAYLPLNPESLIEERTGQAVDALRWAEHLDVRTEPPDWDRWQESVRLAVGSAASATGLLGIKGVNYPVASAFLCILNPQAFPVMDRWALLDLYGGVMRPERYYNAASYMAYTEALVRSAAQSDWSVHQLDKAAMERGMATRRPPSPSPGDARDG